MATKSARTGAPVIEDGVILGESRADNPLMPLDDLDTEEMWDRWIDDLKGSEATGTVQVYKLPVDSEGNPSMAKGSKQIFLMSCPHQQYSFEDLISIIKTKFMMPGELATIRISGRRSGSRGVMFNKIVTIQREAGTTPGSPDTPATPVLGVIQAMQNQNQRTAEMMERILGGQRPGEFTPPKPTSESIKEWLGILGPIFAPVILAYVNRPAQKTDLEGMMGALVKMKDMMDGNGGGSNEEDTTLGIVKAVAGPGLQLLNTLAQNHKAPTPTPQRVRQIPPRIAATQTPPLRASVGTPAGQHPPQSPVSIQQPPVESSPVAQGAAAVSQVSTENDAMLAQLAPQIDQLTDLAARGENPVEVAKMVMDMLPSNDQVDSQLYAIVSTPAAFNRLALLAPKMKAHEAWFEQLRVALLAEFADEEPPAS